jgi:hypothetical protein
MVEVQRPALSVIAGIHGFPVGLTPGVRAPLRKGAGKLIGEFKFPLIHLAQGPGIAVVGKAAEFLDGVPPTAFRVPDGGRGSNGRSG